MWPNLQSPVDLIIFSEEILNGKLPFLCIVFSNFLVSNFSEKHWIPNGFSKSSCTHDVTRTYIRHSENYHYVFWTSHVRSIYVPCPGGHNIKKGDGLGSSVFILDCEFLTSSFRSSRPEVFYKKVFLKISQNLQENICARVFFLAKSQVET